VIKSKAELNGLIGTEQKQKNQVALTNLQKLKKVEERSNFNRLAKKEVALIGLQKWKKEVATELKHGQEVATMNL
jgi:ABC-type branched-subunit amino acid transport system ATPase component